MVQSDVEDTCAICGAPTLEYVCADCEYWHYGRGMQEDEGEEEDDQDSDGLDKCSLMVYNT